MKTILVDAVYAFVSNYGEIFQEMYDLLEKYPNRKILLTSTGDDLWKQRKLDEMPYKVFTLKNNPPKSDQEYYKRLLKDYSLKAEEVIYFEHNQEAVTSAELVGIKTY